MNIHPTGAELFHLDGQTDVMKLLVSFPNFVKAPKTYLVLCRQHNQAALQDQLIKPVID